MYAPLDTLKSMEAAQIIRHSKMPNQCPPTPEEHLTASFREPSPTGKQSMAEAVARDSALPTPNSPPRHSFSSKSQDSEHQDRDPLVVPLHDETTDSRPLFADIQLDPASDTQIKRISSRSSTPDHPIRRHASTPDPSPGRDGGPIDLPGDTASPLAAKTTVSRSKSPSASPARHVFRSPTVTVPGTTIVLPNTVDAVLAYYRNNLREIQGLQKAQREAREPATSASAESFTRDQVNALNKIPTNKRKATHAVATDDVVLSSTKRQRPSITRASSPPPAPHKPSTTVAPKPKKGPITPRVRASSTFSDRSPQNVKHQRSGPQKKALWPELKMDQWRQADNYCPPFDMDKPIGLKVPPTTSTGTNSKKTPAPWNDAEIARADIDQLHPEELALAKDLRVEPQAYLMTKRRIFAARVRALVEHQNWNKTCAQQAVQMDVNKASRFFLAFDAVGWFEERHFPAEVQDQWRENEKKKTQKAS